MNAFGATSTEGKPVFFAAPLPKAVVILDLIFIINVLWELCLAIQDQNKK
jgi:hypothetical protein